MDQLNVQQYIMDAAKQEVESKVKVLVAEKLKPITAIMLSIDKIRAGDRKAYMDLDSISKHSIDPFVKSMADSILEVKAKDYEESIQDISFLTDLLHLSV